WQINRDVRISRLFGVVEYKYKLLVWCCKPAHFHFTRRRHFRMHPDLQRQAEQQLLCRAILMALIRKSDERANQHRIPTPKLPLDDRRRAIIEVCQHARTGGWLQDLFEAFTGRGLLVDSGQRAYLYIQPCCLHWPNQLLACSKNFREI